LSRITLTTALVLTPFALYLQRQVFYKIHILFHQRGWSQRRVLIYGAGDIGIHLAKRLFESPSLGYFPAGVIDDTPEKQNLVVKWQGIGPHAGVPVLGGESVLREVARKHDVEL